MTSNRLTVSSVACKLVKSSLQWSYCLESNHCAAVQPHCRPKPVLTCCRGSRPHSRMTHHERVVSLTIIILFSTIRSHFCIGLSISLPCYKKEVAFILWQIGTRREACKTLPERLYEEAKLIAFSCSTHLQPMHYYNVSYSFLYFLFSYLYHSIAFKLTLLHLKHSKKSCYASVHGALGIQTSIVNGRVLHMINKSHNKDWPSGAIGWVNLPAGQECVRACNKACNVHDWKKEDGCSCWEKVSLSHSLVCRRHSCSCSCRLYLLKI